MKKKMVSNGEVNDDGFWQMAQRLKVIIVFQVVVGKALIAGANGFECHFRV